MRRRRVLAMKLSQRVTSADEQSPHRASIETLTSSVLQPDSCSGFERRVVPEREQAAKIRAELDPVEPQRPTLENSRRRPTSVMATRLSPWL